MDFVVQNKILIYFGHPIDRWRPIDFNPSYPQNFFNNIYYKKDESPIKTTESFFRRPGRDIDYYDNRLVRVRIVTWLEFNKLINTTYY